MKNKLISTVGAAAALILVASSSTAMADNLVQNGGFEQLNPDAVESTPGAYFLAPDIFSNPAANWSFSNSNGTTLENILFTTDGSADNSGADDAAALYGPNNGYSNGFVLSPTGGNFVALDGDPEGSGAALTQTINGLTVGQSYSLSFSFASAEGLFEGTGPTTIGVKVGFGTDTASTAIRNTPDMGFTPWAQESFTFVAKSTSQVLSFMVKNGPDGLPPLALIDNVSLSTVAAVPEPSSWAMLIAGVGVLGFVRSRRSAKTRAST